MESIKNVVFLGSVNHGKSTLIGRLLHDTGSITPDKIEEVKQICAELNREFEYCYLLDALSEEREQNITIDIAHIDFRTKLSRYSIIDAPGHKEFTKNMITGACKADIAILLVDVLEGICEQTKRHAYILQFLQIKNLIVIVNKMDAVNYEKSKFDTVSMQVTDFLKSLSIKANVILPISAKYGINLIDGSTHMPWYDGLPFLTELDKITVSVVDEGTDSLFPVQDSYVMNGISISVGRLESGKLLVNQKVEILPERSLTSIVKIHEFGNDSKGEVCYMESVGLSFDRNIQVGRGKIISSYPTSLVVAQRFEASLFNFSSSELTEGQHVTVRIVNQEISGVIGKIHHIIDSSTFDKRAAVSIPSHFGAVVTILLDKPIAFSSFSSIVSFGRFVIILNNVLSAGGTIFQ